MKWPTKWVGCLAPIVPWCFVLFLSACSKREQGDNSFGPPEVLVTEVLQQDVPVIREWIGSLDGSVNADIRARVSGYLISQDYKEGRLVKTGDLLFQIDPTTYEAALEQAKAALAQAKANQVQTEQAEQRMRELFAQKVESAQNRDTAGPRRRGFHYHGDRWGGGPGLAADIAFP